MEEEGQGAVPPAPKIIHFVWAGGNFRMPPKSMEVVIEWLIKNPDFTIYLWVDEKTDDDPEGLLEDYTFRFGTIYEELKTDFEHEQELFTCHFVTHEKNEEQPLVPGKIIIKDLGRNNLRNKWVAYFIELLKPNYGASSDLLRGKILFEFGGAYFDTDVSPGPKRLGELPVFNEFGCHRVLVEDFTQVNELKPFQLDARFDLENPPIDQYVGNDTFGCTKNNPLMQSLFDFSLKRLTEMSKSEDGKFALCYGARDIKYFTVYATGPKAVRDCIDFYPRKYHNRSPRGGFDVVIDPKGKRLLGRPVGPVVDVRPVRYVDNIPAIPLPPAHNWLQVSEQSFEPEKLKCVMRATVLFEYEHFKVVRIDDHIEDLIRLSMDFDEMERFNEQSAFEFIVGCFPNEELRSRDVMLKVTGRFEISLNHFNEALPSSRGAARKMVACMSYWGDFCGYFLHENEIEEKAGYSGRLEKYFDRKEGGPRSLPAPLIRILRVINSSIDAFAVYCRPELPFFAQKLGDEVKKQVLEYLQKYRFFLERVIRVIPDESLSVDQGKGLANLIVNIHSMIESLVSPKRDRSLDAKALGKKF